MADKRDRCAEWLADAVENLSLLTPKSEFATDFVGDLHIHVRDVGAALVVDCEERDCVGRLFLAKMIIDRACQRACR